MSDICAAQATEITNDLIFGYRIAEHFYTLHTSRVSAQVLKSSSLEAAVSMRIQDPLYGGMAEELRRRFQRIRQGDVDIWNKFLEEVFGVGHKREAEPAVAKEKRRSSSKADEKLGHVSSGRVEKASSSASSQKKMDDAAKKDLIEAIGHDVEKVRGATVHPNLYKRLEEGYFDD